MNLKQLLEAQVTEALQASGAMDSSALVKQASKPEFGHYQANGIMGAAKRQGMKPRDLASATLKQLHNASGPDSDGKTSAARVAVPFAVSGDADITQPENQGAINADTQVMADAELDADNTGTSIMANAELDADNTDTPVMADAELDADNTGTSIMADAEIAGPGFINITLRPTFIASCLMDLARDERLGVATQAPETIVIDYSSPNLAKEMHIGHLRSTAIGDAAVRILEFLGHDVVRINHVGDWGTQFGSLLAYMNKLTTEGEALATELKDLEAFYQSASQLFKTDEAFAREARQFVVRLQGGDPDCIKLWQEFINESLDHCDAIYQRLGISLTRQDVKAESFYNDELASTVKLLEQQGLVTLSNGAKCIFLPEFTGKDDEPLPAIVQKSDGGYPYFATDLASLRHRFNDLHADRALYFIDARQTLHMRQLFAIGKAAGFINDQEFRHIPFGSILNKAGKPYKTREGNAVKLADVVDEAVNRAAQLVAEKNPDLPDERRQDIAEAVGTGAIKYAELSKNRSTDYIFDWDTMLSFEGDTAPYLQYAYTRIRSIFRRSGMDPAALSNIKPALHEAQEINLAIKLLQYPEALEAAVEDYQANILTSYLFELAGIFMGFYENCPVLKAEGDRQKTRLLLCRLTADILRHGLDLLGIKTPEQM